MDLTLDQQRELTYKRVKRLHEYDFVPDSEILANPAKFSALARAVEMYDVSVSNTYGLSRIVRSSEQINFILCLCLCTYFVFCACIDYRNLLCIPRAMIFPVQLFTSVARVSGTQRHQDFADDCVAMKVKYPLHTCTSISCLQWKRCLPPFFHLYVCRCLAVLLSLRCLMVVIPGL